jgi:hypothetical protein
MRKGEFINEEVVDPNEVRMIPNCASECCYCNRRIRTFDMYLVFNLDLLPDKAVYVCETCFLSTEFKDLSKIIVQNNRGVYNRLSDM